MNENGTFLKRGKFLSLSPSPSPSLFYGNESATRRRWLKNNAGRKRRRVHGHAANDQVPVCWSLNLNLTPLCIHIPGYVYLYLYADPTCVKFDLAPDLWGT